MEQQCHHLQHCYRNPSSSTCAMSIIPTSSAYSEPKNCFTSSLVPAMIRYVPPTVKYYAFCLHSPLAVTTSQPFSCPAAVRYPTQGWLPPRAKLVTYTCCRVRFCYIDGGPVTTLNLGFCKHGPIKISTDTSKAASHNWVKKALR